MNTLQAITEFTKMAEELRQFKNKMDEYNMIVEFGDRQDVIELNYSTFQGFYFDDDELCLSTSEEINDVSFYNIYEKPTPEDFKKEMIDYLIDLLSDYQYPPFSLSLLKDMLSIAKELESQELSQAVHEYMEKQ